MFLGHNYFKHFLVSVKISCVTYILPFKERAPKLEETEACRYRLYCFSFQLQVKDEALSLLMSMGYQEHAAKRALRMSNQEVESAVNFLVEEKERIARRDEEDIWRRREIT